MAMRRSPKDKTDQVGNIARTSSPFARGSDGCRITAAQGERNGDFVNVTVGFEYKNVTDVTWTGTRITAQVIDHVMGVAAEVESFFNVSIPPGKTHRAVIDFESISADGLLDGSNNTIIVSGYGCTGGETSIGTFDIPDDPGKASGIRRPLDLENQIRVISLSITKTEPDEDRGVIVTMRALLQNLSTSFVAYAGLCGDIAGASGELFSLTPHGIALGPGELRLYEELEFTNSYDAKEAILSVRAYFARTCFVSEHCGIEMARPIGARKASKKRKRPTDPLRGRRVRIRFPLTKGDGEYPDVSLLPPKKRTDDYLASFLSFNADFGEAGTQIESWEMINDGIAQFREDGYPAPIIDFVLKKPLTKNKLEEFLGRVCGCSYSLDVPGINDGPEGDPYLFEDQNGYSHIVDVW